MFIIYVKTSSPFTVVDMHVQFIYNDYVHNILLIYEYIK